MPRITINNKSFNNVELVLFDKDGTLIDIHHYWVSMIKLRAKILVDRYFSGANNKMEFELINLMGVDIINNKMKPNGPIGVRPREFIVNIVTCLLTKNKIDTDNSKIEGLFKEVDKATESDFSSLIKLLPNVELLLQDLRGCNIKMAIVSTDITHRAILAMKAVGLEGFFDVIVGGDAVEKTKPSPDLALYVMSKLNISADNVLVIGDHLVDMKMAQAANILTNVGVLTGISNKEDFLCENIEIIDNLNFINVK